ncbi:Pentatricopeptide repeat-containing protein [Platanthera guangdongensis]|uniref:Pentatricopeptide repeat-containing protein n=1 Tax=Platanthera guangdongensis TaxID=2320717 RepID=A0ABR2LR31_9ASPA
MRHSLQNLCGKRGRGTCLLPPVRMRLQRLCLFLADLLVFKLPATVDSGGRIPHREEDGHVTENQNFPRNSSWLQRAAPFTAFVLLVDETTGAGVPSHQARSHCTYSSNNDRRATAGGGMRSLVRLSDIQSFTPTADGCKRRCMNLSDLIRHGRLREARQVFDSLPYRKVISWNSMISGYARHGEVALARRLFDEMPLRDVISWNCMLSGYVMSYDLGELMEARRLFDQMPARDVISWNTMISGYTRNGKMVEAMQLFGGMPERNVISWNTVLTGFLRVGDVKSALELFGMMPIQDSTSLNALVSGLIQNNLLGEATKILLRSIKEASEMEGAVDSFNTLIVGYGRVGRVKEARRVFDLIPLQDHAMPHQEWTTKRFQRNVISWNSMIMCYIKAGDLLHARRLFDEMPERDLVSWNTMIAGYVQALKMDEAVLLFQSVDKPDTRSWNTLMCGFAQMGDVGKARSLFDQLPHKGLVSWNTMIAGYEQNGDFEGAIRLFSEMLSAGERFDRHTMSSLLSACAGLASLRQGAQIHQLIMKTIVPDAPISNSLITMYSRCGSITEAENVFDSMEAQRNVISWNSMIAGYANHGFVVEALGLFKKMKNAKIQPTQVTFIAVLHACGHAGMLDEGKREFDSMIEEFKLFPNVEHYTALVDLLGRHGKLDEAMEVINGMVIPPDRSVWGALLGACRVHNEPGLADIAAEGLAAVEPSSCAPYVLRYNIHADEGRWEEALQLRELINKKGLFKQPGYSWIELQNKVHAFIAGDCSHPLSEEIYSLVEIFNRISRDSHLDGFAKQLRIFYSSIEGYLDS